MKNKCVHRYLTNCRTNPQPPGIADFLRGCVALFILSKRYDFDFFIDWSSHPIFKNFEYDESIFVRMAENVETIESIPPKSFQDIYNHLIFLFERKEDFNILTNSPYFGWGVDYGFSTEEIESGFEYIKKVLNLEKSRLVEYEDVKKRMGIADGDYTTIHLRFYDQCLTYPNFGVSQMMFNNFMQFVSDVEKGGGKIVILSNWMRFVDYVLQFKPNLLCFGGKPIHTGELDKHIGSPASLIDEKLRDTVFDLKILSESKKIYSISQYGGSGFSNLMSEIYHIDFEHISDRIL